MHPWLLSITWGILPLKVSLIHFQHFKLFNFIFKFQISSLRSINILTVLPIKMLNIKSALPLKRCQDVDECSLSNEHVIQPHGENGTANCGIFAHCANTVGSFTCTCHPGRYLRVVLVCVCVLVWVAVGDGSVYMWMCVWKVLAKSIMLFFYCQFCKNLSESMFLTLTFSMKTLDFMSFS